MSFCSKLLNWSRRWGNLDRVQKLCKRVIYSLHEYNEVGHFPVQSVFFLRFIVLKERLRKMFNTLVKAVMILLGKQILSKLREEMSSVPSL